MMAAVDLHDGLRWTAELPQMASVGVRFQRLLHISCRLQMTLVAVQVEIPTIWEHAGNDTFLHLHVSRGSSRGTEGSISGTVKHTPPGTAQNNQEFYSEPLSSSSGAAPAEQRWLCSQGTSAETDILSRAWADTHPLRIISLPLLQHVYFEYIWSIHSNFPTNKPFQKSPSRLPLACNCSLPEATGGWGSPPEVEGALFWSDSVLHSDWSHHWNEKGLYHKKRDHST